MEIIYAVLIAIANNIDNIGVRVAYSVGGVRVSLWKNIVISSFAFTVSFLSALSGNIASKFLNPFATEIISTAVLILMALLLIFKKENVDIKGLKELSFKEAVLVGIALSLDDIGGSVSTGLNGTSPLLIGVMFAAISFIIFALGNSMIRVFRRLSIGNTANIASGVIMIIVAIAQLIG